MPGQHDSTPVQTVIYKPNEHADEYIVAIDDVAEVGPPSLSSRVEVKLMCSTNNGRLTSLLLSLDSSDNSLS